MQSDLTIAHHALLDAFLQTALVAGAALAFCGLLAVATCMIFVLWDPR